LLPLPGAYQKPNVRENVRGERGSVFVTARKEEIEERSSEEMERLCTLLPESRSPSTSASVKVDMFTLLVRFPKLRLQEIKQRNFVSKEPNVLANDMPFNHMGSQDSSAFLTDKNVQVCYNILPETLTHAKITYVSANFAENNFLSNLLSTSNAYLVFLALLNLFELLYCPLFE
jgi:hypothetical protein